MQCAGSFDELSGCKRGTDQHKVSEIAEEEDTGLGDGESEQANTILGFSVTLKIIWIHLLPPEERAEESERERDRQTNKQTNKRDRQTNR